MSIYLDPESEDGNIEYKRCLINIDKERLEEYATQMTWRVGEGNGEAIYYLGIEDNGSFYNWSDSEKNQSLKTFKNVTIKANLKIARLEKIYYTLNDKQNYYLKIVIRDKQKVLPEKRVLILGSSGIGKSTFIANIVLSKIDEENKEARMYLFNHKHEIIKKKTSSFNYMYIIHNNIKWVFIEVPGDEKYIKTSNKIVLSFGSSINCSLFLDDNWSRNDYYKKYFTKMNIPFVHLDIYKSDNVFPNYNCKNLINKNEFFENLLFKSNNIEYNKKTEFIVIDTFNIPLKNEIILTGILKGGKLIVSKTYFLNSNNKIFDIKITSIHLDGKPLNKCISPATISISIESNNLSPKDLIGIITEEPLNKINNYIIEDCAIGKKIYKDNKILKIEDLKNCYQTNDNIFLVENGLGLII